MQTERIAIDSFFSDRKLREDLVHRILGGAVFVYPTETIYGVGGAFGVSGVHQRIIDAKSRAPENPMILIAGRPEQLKPLSLRFPPKASELAKRHWPGNVTLVVPGTDGGYQGVRISPHPFVQSLFELLHTPIYSTSANRSGEPYDGDPEVIYSTFEGMIDFMIDAGTLLPSEPSTVVRISPDDEIEVLRGRLGRVGEDGDNE